MLVGCSGQDGGVGGTGGVGGVGDEAKNTDSTVTEENGNGSTDGQGSQRNEGFVLKAIVKSTSDPNRIEAEVIESDYAFGIYWVLTSGDTVFYSADGVGNGRKIALGFCVV